MKSKTHPAKAVDLAAIREKLADQTGPRYWRGLDQLAETPEFLDYLQREFPVAASEWDDKDSRREFLRLMAAPLALAGVAGVTGCSYQPQEKIVPYVKPPEQMVQGQALHYATSMTLRGYSMGLLAKSREGRPIKIEGNDKHPSSLGATDLFSQASILGLYDPDRSGGVVKNGRLSSWDDFQEAMLDEFVKRRGQAASGRVRILTGAVGSPTLSAQLLGLLEEYPGAKWYQYESVSDDNALEGAKLAFGRAVETRYKLDGPRVILALDSDFLVDGPAAVTLSRAFADARDPDREGQATPATMNRLYVVEGTATLTGAKADHRLPLKPSQIGDFALALAREIGVEGLPESTRPLDQTAIGWVKPVADDLKSRDGEAVVIVGRAQPPVVHALAHAINARLGAVGKSVEYADPIVADATGAAATLRTLAQEMLDGKVELLVMIGVNPVYDAPADIDFRDAMDLVKVRVHAGLYNDETGEVSNWHVPLCHYLEAWGDGRAFDGTVTIQQPLIQPLYGAVAETEVVAALRGVRNPDSRSILEVHWKAQLGVEGEDAAFGARWRGILEDGLIEGSAFETVGTTLAPTADWAKLDAPTSSESQIELVFAPDPTVFDGRFANNGWLQECPKPLTKLTWDNALMVSPGLAARLGLAIGGGDVVTLTYDTRSLKVATWVDPGQPDGAVTLHLGYGRTKAGRVGTPREGQGGGFNASKLRTSSSPWIAVDAQISRGTEQYILASTQTQRTLEGRNLVREGTIEQYEREPNFAKDLAPHESFYPPIAYTGYAWAMTMDLTRCTGCSACIVACQSENNIAVVGKDQVHRNRAMHWLEIDRYYASDAVEVDRVVENPRVLFQPRACMHCETAPCEVVCPVGATVHDHEGLNNMVYNRCVGTRYCSNNCPYKVRKFNFLKYTNHALKSTSPTGDMMDSPLTLLMNPEVTVRPRGVMEKCTYCVQRIYEAKIHSEVQSRTVRDGEIVTACEAACPTRTITFGDKNNPDSRVSKMKLRQRDYGMLTELNTGPRTTYLAGIRNPNPALEAV